MSGPSAVSDPQHPARLLRALSSFREESRFCDAHLVLEGEEIPVQKNILAAASPYIRCGGAGPSRGGYVTGSAGLRAAALPAGRCASGRGQRRPVRLRAAAAGPVGTLGAERPACLPACLHAGLAWSAGRALPACCCHIARGAPRLSFCMLWGSAVFCGTVSAFSSVKTKSKQTECEVGD